MNGDLLAGLVVGLFIGGFMGTLVMAVVATGSGRRFPSALERRNADAGIARPAETDPTAPPPRAKP
jgi:hypothetical protein